MRIDRNKKSFFVPSVKLFFIIKMSNPLLWFYLNVKCQLYDRRIKKLVSLSCFFFFKIKTFFTLVIICLLVRSLKANMSINYLREV
jgi:hypothetical protein